MDHASSAEVSAPNPSAIHGLGIKEKNKLEGARATIADVLGAHSDEIIFTSGATESNNLAILGASQNQTFSQVLGSPGPQPGPDHSKKFGFVKHIITTNIEHASVLEAVRHRGNFTFVLVDNVGLVDPKQVRKALRPDTVLVSVMYANNEIGSIQPIREIAKEIRHFNKVNSTKILFHTDAVQAVNYLPINVEKLGVDLMSINAAKIYGPKGVGVLYVRRRVSLNAIMFGGDQERGLRPGTENVSGVLAFARALLATEKIKEKESKRLTILRDYFIKELSKKNILINGDLSKRLPNNINITVPNIPSDLLVIELSARGIMASAKSACKSGDGKSSHVIQAINPTIKDTDGSIRFSLGRDTTKADIVYTLKNLEQILSKLKKWY